MPAALATPSTAGPAGFFASTAPRVFAPRGGLACALLSLGLVCHLTVFGAPEAQAADAADARIHTVAVRIGDHAVSAYLVDKYFGRFCRWQPGAPPPTATAENRAWMENFFAKQVLIAHATTLGYAERPEVVRTVARMERHMLTQPVGPFYQRLFAQRPITQSDVESAYEGSLVSVDAAIARFSSRAEAAAALGADFQQLPPIEQFQKLTAHTKDAGRGRAANGRLGWPFFPFPEIAERIVSTPAGHGLIHETPMGEAYAIFIRAAEKRPRPAGAPPPDFVVMARHVWEQVIQQQHRREQLAKAGLLLDEENLRRLAGRFATLGEEPSKIPDTMTAGLDALPLATYRIGPESRSITVAAYVEDLQSRFIRQVPGGIDELRASVEDAVLAELDYQAARALGIDRTAQFAEDRRGFLGFQILDLFEKERLLPELTIESANVQAYYEAHRGTFLRTSKVRGRLLRFDSMEDAATWANQAATPTNRKGAKAPREEIVELTEAKTVPGLEKAMRPILNSPPGARIGPLPAPGGAVVFIKTEDSEKTPLPLAAVQKEIESRLTRDWLDSRERALAREIAKTVVVTDRTDYARYGLAAPALDLPWSARSGSQ